MGLRGGGGGGGLGLMMMGRGRVCLEMVGGGCLEVVDIRCLWR